MNRLQSLRTCCALLALTTAVSGCHAIRDRLSCTRDICVAGSQYILPARDAEPAATAWPGSSDGLVFAWTDGTPASLKPWGKAHITERGALELTDGAFVVEGHDQKLLDACRRSNELTIEAVLQTKRDKQGGPARIISFSQDSNIRNFTLGQEGGNLILRLRTPMTGINGSPPETTLCPIRSDRPIHLLVTYRTGDLTCFVNGKEVLRTDKVRGDFSNWVPQHLILGDEYSRERDWDGRLTRVAIFSRHFSTDDAHDQYERVLRSARK
jgi:hypothetical protein